MLLVELELKFYLKVIGTCEIAKAGRLCEELSDFNKKSALKFRDKLKLPSL